MLQQVKSIPVMGDPGNVNAFTGLATRPSKLSRPDAAKALWTMRDRVRRNQGRLERLGHGLYQLVGLNTMVMFTKSTEQANGLICQ